MENSVSRRKFVTTVATAAAATSLVNASLSLADEFAGYEISDTRDVDIVVVGAGISGLAAAVEAADKGASVVLLEKLGTVGGNGKITCGPSGFDTKYSRAAGITYDWHEAVVEDQRMFNYIPNIGYYIDMAQASSDNIDWVADHGVVISDVVDNYKGGNNTMHYWGAGSGSKKEDGSRITNGTEYTIPMEETALNLGVEIMYATPAVDIVMDGKAVTGVIAQNAEGAYIQVNAKATVLATGGICGNDELMARAGRVDNIVSSYTFCKGCTGDGYNLSMKAGAFDMFGRIGFIEQPAFAEMGTFEEYVRTNDLDPNLRPNKNDNHPVWNILKLGKCIWVNELGERFCDESAGKPDGGVAGWATSAIVSQRKAFAICDAHITQDILGQDCIDIMMENANYFGTKYQADTLEELAEQLGIDSGKLHETIDRYNEVVGNGVDTDFGKWEEGLVAIGDGPYFATQLSVSPLCSIGGVRVNRSMQACDVNWGAIPGLYVIGVDSFPFYTQMYYYQLPGSACAFELHSALVAARHAVDNLL